MARMSLPAPVARLIEELSRLPGIGPRSAQRLAFYLLRSSPDLARNLATALTNLQAQTLWCSRCFNLSERDPCPICQDPDRDQDRICVVEEPLDLLAIERTGLYAGLYHVLHGSLSPLEGRNVEDVKIAELVARLRAKPVQELILALDADHEGDTTASYVAQVAEAFATRITRLARGLPTGADLEYADESTIASALQGRQDNA